jgi:YD repeat-containing protein
MERPVLTTLALLIAAPFVCAQPRITAGDPVDLFTGLYVNTSTDIALDSTPPIAIRRVYRPEDRMSRAFGIGTNHNYDIFLVGDHDPYTYIDLILEDGGRVHFERTSRGKSFEDAVYRHTGTHTQYENAVLAWNASWRGWDMKLRDGSLYQFPESRWAQRGSQAALIRIQDPLGNSLQFVRSAGGDLTRIVSSSGRKLAFTYDAGHRVTLIQDDAGRSVQYAYDAKGRLVQVVGVDGATIAYSYDDRDRMLTVGDAEGNLSLRMVYDRAGRCVRQILPDGRSFRFAYTTASKGKTLRVDVIQPDGAHERVIFNAAGYPVSDTVIPAGGEQPLRTTSAFTPTR